MVFINYHSHVGSNMMKIYNKVFISLGLLSGLSLFNQAYAFACTWKPGSERTPSVEIGTATNLVGVNNGIYPAPMNFALANITTAPYGGNAPGWGLICTAPMTVTPRLFMVRYPDTRFPGYPYLQDTNNTPFYSTEMTYTTPTGVLMRFGQLGSGSYLYGTPFVLAENATPTNPVEINLRSLNINSVALQGYQTAAATRTNTVWGTGGTLNDIFFNFVDPNGIALDVGVRFFIYEIAFDTKTCAIDSNDRNKTVNLGAKAERDFSSDTVGGVSNSTPFRVSFRCEAGAALTYRVNTTPDTAADPGNTKGLIKFSGANSATGYALQLRAAPFKEANGNLTPVPFGVAVSSGTSASGTISNDFIDFDARYYRTLPIAQSTPGMANATVTIDVNYQ